MQRIASAPTPVVLTNEEGVRQSYFTERNPVIFECVICAPFFIGTVHQNSSFVSTGNAGYLGKIRALIQAKDGKQMKFDIDATLIAQFLEVLKTPHIAEMVEWLGGLWILGWIFIAYVKARKE